MTKHDRPTLINQRPNQDHNEAIQLLSELFPKCFFAIPKQRRPLKPTIIDDLEKEKANDPELARYDIPAAVNWYTTHIGYDHACVAGAKRLDLEGRAVGVVTESAAREAQERINVAHERMNARRRSVGSTEINKPATPEDGGHHARHPVPIVQTLHGRGGMTNDQLRKIPAPAMSGPAENDIERKLNDAIAALTKTRELLTMDNSALRNVLVRGALSVAETNIQDVLKHNADAP